MTAFVAFVVFLTLLSLASALGWVVNSRDGADWAPTENGHRARRTL